MTARHNCTSTVSLSITQMTEKTAGDRAGQSARGLFLRGPWKQFACVPVTEQLATGPAERKKKKEKRKRKASLSFARCFNDGAKNNHRLCHFVGYLEVLQELGGEAMEAY